MPFTRKFAADYDRDLLGMWQALSGAIDLNEGSPDRQLSTSISQMFEVLDARVAAIREAHGLKARNTDLDDVIAQIMSGRAIERGGATAAAGPAMQYTRESGTGALTVPAGVRFRSNADPTMQYVAVEEIEFVDGQTVYPSPSQTPVQVVCLTRGIKGNMPSGTVSTIVPGSGMPTGVYAATNIERIGGGEDAEQDDSFAQRGRLLLASIAKSQPLAMRSLASRYVGADGTTIRSAILVEPADMAGYAELIVSDGKGLPGLTRTAALVSGTVGASGMRTVYFDPYAATEPSISLDGGAYVAASSLPGATVIHERGELEFSDGNGLTAGTTYSIGLHRVYTGVIAEIQRKIEGNTAALAVLDYGWRSGGIRIRVRPPLLFPVAFTVRAEYKQGVVISEGQANTKADMDAFTAGLDLGGRKLNLFQMGDEVAKRGELEDFEVLSPAQNVEPPTKRHQLYTNASMITFV